MVLLNSLDKLAEHLPLELHWYIDLFSALKAVVENLFSVRGPPENYEKIIDDFKRIAKENNVNLTPTIHSINIHVKDFYRLNGTEFGLGLYSEQAGEHVHHDFGLLWESAYKRHEGHTEFGSQLLKAVAKYNANHI